MAKAIKTWFRHSVNAHNNFKIKSLVGGRNLDCYGAYFILVEIVAGKLLECDSGDFPEKIKVHFSTVREAFGRTKNDKMFRMIERLCQHELLRIKKCSDHYEISTSEVAEYIGFYSPKESKESKENKENKEEPSSSSEKQGEKSSTSVPETPPQQEAITEKIEPDDAYQHSIKSNGQLIHTGSYLGESKPTAQRSSKKTSREDYDTFIKTFFGLKQLGDCKSYYGKIDDFLNSTGRNIADLQQAALNIEFMKNNTNKFGYFTKNLDTLLDPTKDFDKYLDSSLCGFFIDKSAPRDTIYLNLSEEEGKKALDELRRKGVLK